MKTFKEFSSQFNKKYVCVHFDETTVKNLRGFADKFGFDLTMKFDKETKISPEEFDFHTTIFYTDNELCVENNEIDINVTNSIIGIELLGMNKDIPVLTLGNGFNKIREKFEKAGFRDTWGSYKPHISLSYKWSGKPEVNKVDIPKFKINATKLIIKNQED